MACKEMMDNIEEDKISISSERLFKETYHGASRRWILRDASKWKDSADIPSTMKDEYRTPEHDDSHPPIGIRRMQHRQKLLKEKSDEVWEEWNRPPPIEEYCTEYDVKYAASGFTPKEREWDPELHKKYPLYDNHAVTYYKFQLDKNTGTSLPGYTTPKDMKNPFKKSSSFTTAINEILDVPDGL